MHSIPISVEVICGGITSDWYNRNIMLCMKDAVSVGISTDVLQDVDVSVVPPDQSGFILCGMQGL